MVRQATMNDAMRIAEIIIYGWRFAYSGLISETVLYKTLSVVKRYNALIDVMNGDHGYYVYEEDEIVKGVFLVGDSREEGDSEETLELVAIYVEPAFKHQGIGTKLIKACEVIAKSRDKKEIKLWVLEDNTSSRAFYEKNGFNALAVTKKIDQLGLMEVRYVKLIED